MIRIIVLVNKQNNTIRLDYENTTFDDIGEVQLGDSSVGTLMFFWISSPIGLPFDYEESKKYFSVAT